MIAASIALAGYVFVLGHLTGPLLLHRRWSTGLPGTAVALWAAAAAGALLALTALLGLALLWPSTPGHRLVDWLTDCLQRRVMRGCCAATGTGR
jgi:hypothetical protein